MSARPMGERLDVELLRLARAGEAAAVDELLARGWHLSVIERYTKRDDEPAGYDYAAAWEQQSSTVYRGR